MSMNKISIHGSRIFCFAVLFFSSSSTSSSFSELRFPFNIVDDLGRIGSLRVLFAYETDLSLLQILLDFWKFRRKFLGLPILVNLHRLLSSSFRRISLDTKHTVREYSFQRFLLNLMYSWLIFRCNLDVIKKCPTKNWWSVKLTNSESNSRNHLVRFFRVWFVSRFFFHDQNSMIKFFEFIKGKMSSTRWLDFIPSLTRVVFCLVTNLTFGVFPIMTEHITISSWMRFDDIFLTLDIFSKSISFCTDDTRVIDIDESSEGNERISEIQRTSKCTVLYLTAIFHDATNKSRNCQREGTRCTCLEIPVSTSSMS